MDTTGPKAQTPRPILFADFRPGALLGQVEQRYDEALAAPWREIFNEASGPPEAASLAVVLMMRAFLSVVSPRPPGNVHARQRLSLHRLPAPGEVVRSTVRCESAQLRRERRYVELSVSGRGANGAPLYDGLLTLIWAA